MDLILFTVNRVHGIVPLKCGVQRINVVLIKFVLKRLGPTFSEPLGFSSVFHVSLTRGVSSAVRKRTEELDSGSDYERWVWPHGGGQNGSSTPRGGDGWRLLGLCSTNARQRRAGAAGGGGGWWAVLFGIWRSHKQIDIKGIPPG